MAYLVQHSQYSVLLQHYNLCKQRRGEKKQEGKNDTTEPKGYYRGTILPWNDFNFLILAVTLDSVILGSFVQACESFTFVVFFECQPSEALSSHRLLCVDVACWFHSWSVEPRPKPVPLETLAIQRQRTARTSRINWSNCRITKKQLLRPIFIPWNGTKRFKGIKEIWREVM